MTSHPLMKVLPTGIGPTCQLNKLPVQLQVPRSILGGENVGSLPGERQISADYLGDLGG